MDKTRDSGGASASSHVLAYDAGRPGWCDTPVAADEILMTIAPADQFGYPGWSSVMLKGKPVRHFPSAHEAHAYITGRDRTYSLVELAEACAVAYARGVAMAQVGQHSISLGRAGAKLFPALQLPALMAVVEWTHELSEGQSGWEVSEEQTGTVLGALAARERQLQTLLAAVDDLVDWLATQSSVAWPAALARGIFAAAAPLREQSNCNAARF